MGAAASRQSWRNSPSNGRAAPWVLGRSRWGLVLLADPLFSHAKDDRPAFTCLAGDSADRTHCQPGDDIASPVPFVHGMLSWESRDAVLVCRVHKTEVN